MANRPPGPEAFSIVQLCSSGPHDKGSAERAHAQAAAVVTYMYVDTPELIEDLIHRKASQHGFKTLVPLRTFSGSAGIPMVLTDSSCIPCHEACLRQDFPAFCLLLCLPVFLLSEAPLPCQPLCWPPLPFLSFPFCPLSFRR